MPEYIHTNKEIQKKIEEVTVVNNELWNNSIDIIDDSSTEDKLKQILMNQGALFGSIGLLLIVARNELKAASPVEVATVEDMEKLG